jgi:protein TonB
MPAPPQRTGYAPRRKPHWGTLALVVALHVLALLGLIRAFAPNFAASAVETVTSVLSVSITAPEEPSPEPDAGAAGEQGEKAVPRDAPLPARGPVQPTDLPDAASTGAATQSGAQDTGEGTGAGGARSGTGSGAGGSGQGGGIASRPSVRSGALNQARDFPVPPGGRQARFGKSVTVNFTVTTDGRARDCSVARSGVDAETAALVCPLVIEKIRFNPARRADGTPIETRYGYRVDFRAAD